MALTYSNFNSFPLQIVGINSDYNSKITAIENFVKSDMAITGATVSDAVLAYFVFWFFCQESASSVWAETGENSQVTEFSEPSMLKQIQAWNLGVDQLRVICGITEEEIRNLSLRYIFNVPSFSYFYEKTQVVFAYEKMKFILDEKKISINMNYLSKRSFL
jgi:hypothetical protein